MSAPAIAWVQVHHDDEPPRWVRPLGKHRDTREQLPDVVLAQRPGTQLWSAWTRTEHGHVVELVMDTTEPLAREVAEAYVRRHAADPNIVLANAEWRLRPPSRRQLSAAAKWHVTVDPTWNAGALSDRLEQHVQRVRAAKAHRATQEVGS